MKYVVQFCVVLVFCCAGEGLRMIFPLPLPSGIYGMILLLAALKMRLVRIESVHETGMFLMSIFPMLFLPAAVGVMDFWPEISKMLLPILIAMIPVTVIVMGVTGLVAQRLIERKRRRHGDSA